MGVMGFYFVWENRLWVFIVIKINFVELREEGFFGVRRLLEKDVGVINFLSELWRWV